MIGVLADLRLRVFLLARLLSILGARGLWLATALWAHETTGRVGAAGSVAIFFVIGALAAPLAGLLVDRIRRRLAIVVADIVAAGTVAVLVVTGPGSDAAHASLWPVYVVMLVTGLCSTVTDPAYTAVAQLLAPPELRAETASAVSIVDQVAGLLAPLLGVALAAAVGLRVVVIVTVVALLLEAALFAALRINEPRPVAQPTVGSPVRRFTDELAGGVRQVRALPVLRDLILAGTAAMVALSLSQAVLLSVIGSVLGRSDDFLGVLVTLQGIAAVLTGLSAPRLLRRSGPRTLAGGGMAAGATGFLLNLIPAVAATVVGSAMIGIASASLAIAVTAVVLDQVPSTVVGRVEALSDLLVSVAQVSGFAIAIATVDLIGGRPLAVAGASILVGGAALLFAGRAHQFSYPPQEVGP